MRIRITVKPKTAEQLRERLEAAWRSGDLRLVRRITALRALMDHQDVAEVARLFAVSEQTIYNWLHAFLLHGVKSLHYETSPGRPAKLSPRQKQRLKALLSQSPEEAGYETGCWHSKLVQDLILREFGVLYDVFYLSELLHTLGLSYQKARFVSDHLDAAERKVWVEQKWPHIVAEAKQRHALLLFSDEASFAQWGSLAYTWAPVGQRPEIKTCGKRKAYKVFGLVDYFSGRLFYRGHQGRFNADSYCAFLTAVLARTTQPIILVQDGARYHTAKKTREFFVQQAARLVVYQLPSYSPDYNPIEHLWRNVKADKTHCRYFATFEKLMQEVEQALRHFTKHTAEVKQLMGTHLDELVASLLAA